MKHYKFKKRCKICREVIEPGYKYMQVPDRDTYICESCTDDMSGTEFLEMIEAKDLCVSDLMDIFDIGFTEDSYGEYDCI